MGLLWLMEKSVERVPWRQVQGVSQGKAAAAHCSPGSKSPGNVCSLWGERGKGKEQCASGKDGMRWGLRFDSF